MSPLRKSSPKKSLEFFRPKLLKKALEGPSIVTGSGKTNGMPKTSDTVLVDIQDDGTVAS